MQNVLSELAMRQQFYDCRKSKQKMAVAETPPSAAITRELEDDINIPDARKVLEHSPRGV